MHDLYMWPLLIEAIVRVHIKLDTSKRQAHIHKKKINEFFFKIRSKQSLQRILMHNE